MSFVSYAQNFEDVMLNRCFGKQKTGFYIDIGAAWPQVDSVTHAFYLKGWRGINVEPNRCNAKTAARRTATRYKPGCFSGERGQRGCPDDHFKRWRPK